MVKRVLLVLILTMFGVAAFASQEALWLRYPAISPDGETVAFCYKGDIFTVSANGGEAKALTSNPAYDYAPVWSPDGKTIAFASDRYGNFDIYTVPVGGGVPNRLTLHSASEYPYSFTPDGKSILFGATILDSAKNAQFPRNGLGELYSIPVDGGRPTQVLTTAALHAKYDKTGQRLIYQDVKGLENTWRKKHTSAVTRDIVIYDVKTNKHHRISPYPGEDMYPVFSNDEKYAYYLSEQFGTFNVCKLALDTPDGKPEAITKHKLHPVRFLSIAKGDKLCYSYDGELYTVVPGQEPVKLTVRVNVDQSSLPVEEQVLSKGATEISVSPDGKETALVIHGEIYVTAVDYTTTKRITNTPEQERSVSFSPDGRAILYAGERNGSWNIYQTTILRKEEKRFSRATLLKEEVILASPAETFQPQYSPDGKEVAFLEERTTLRVINLKTKEVRTVLEGKYNYSYSDGDIVFNWSPDGNYFLISYLGKKRWNTDVGLVDAHGKQEVVNLTQSGYFDESPKWALNGKAMIWASDRLGMRSHGSWGSQMDVYAMFFDQEAYDRFKLSKEEFELLKEAEKKEKDEKKEDDKDKKGKKKENKEKPEPLKPDLKNIEDRIVRLTINSSALSDMILSPDGENLYYLSRFEKGFDLWVNNLRENETKLLLKLNGMGSNLQMDKDGKHLFLLSGGQILKITTANNKRDTISYAAPFTLNKPAESAYLFEHVWRQMKKKFYLPDLGGVDWDFYKKAYARFLPHLDNNRDLAELMSEMLGELNGSHTGAYYIDRGGDGDQTAVLGAFFDENYTGNGLKIEEIIDKSPLLKAGSKIKPGVVIEKIDGQLIEAGKDYYHLLNRKADQTVLLSLLDPSDNTRWDETVNPISNGTQSELLYQRWVKSRRAETERLSNGRIGYVHVRSMDDDSFRVTYSEMLGRYNDKDAIIVDTRYNGGGSLHEDLAKLLSGKKYWDVMPRGQHIGVGPRSQWYKPSCVLMSEGNYSNAHGFPYVYKLLGIGKLIGMPVAGTMTSVWWENLQDPKILFGIPMVGRQDKDGNWLENQQLEPDVKVDNEYDALAAGKDQQLEKAVQVLLETLNTK